MEPCCVPSGRGFIALHADTNKCEACCHGRGFIALHADTNKCEACCHDRGFIALHADTNKCEACCHVSVSSGGLTHMHIIIEYTMAHMQIKKEGVR